MEEISVQTRCFISAPPGADLQVLTRALQQHGYSVCAPNTFAPGERWIDTLRRNLAEADLIIGVFQAGRPVSNVTFELGLAAGLGKRVIAIAPPTIDDLPQAFSAFLVIRAEPTNSEAIGFALEQIAAAPKGGGIKRETVVSPSKILGNEVDKYIQRIESARLESELLVTLRSLLIAAGAEVVTLEPSFGNRLRPDIAIWSDALEPYVGNPLLIEVKRSIHRGIGLQKAVDQLQNYMRHAGSMWSILLYVDGLEGRSDLEFYARTAPNVIVLQMKTFVERLRHESFFHVVRTLRNKRVHGVGGE